jgi:hypothetical protein
MGVAVMKKDTVDYNELICSLNKNAPVEDMFEFIYNSSQLSVFEGDERVNQSFVAMVNISVSEGERVEETDEPGEFNEHNIRIFRWV